MDFHHFRSHHLHNGDYRHENDNSSDDDHHQMGEGRQVRLLLDWSSAEIFIDNGLYAMTSRWSKS